MRDYSIVSGRFWIGETGKVLRDFPDAQRLAMYLITSPHSSMAGLYYCPIPYMAQDIGMDQEGASKGLAKLSQMGFCEFDEKSDMVFVVKMAKFQLGARLAPKDNRRIGLLKELSRLPKTALLQRFFAIYADAYSITAEDIERILQDVGEAPSKPLPSQDQDQDQEQEQKKEEVRRPTPPSPPPLLDLGADPEAEPPKNATPRMLAIYAAMQSETFLVPGKGEQTLWENAKRPVQLAKKLDESCPNVDVATLINKLAGWTVANPKRAKRDLARFVWNAAVKDQDKPRAAADETYRHGTDLADKVRGTRRGKGGR